MSNLNISIIVLCYNDSQSLPKLIAELEQLLKEKTSTFEIIIVDDGSSDNSLQVIKNSSLQHKEIKFVSHIKNRGVGSAFYSGAKMARHEIIGYIDGDGQYSTSDFIRFLSEIEQYDVISGIRVKRADKLNRVIISYLYKLTLQRIFGLKMKDVNSGIKLYRRESLISTFPIISTGAFFDAEIMIKLKASDKKIKEIPISHFERKYGKAGGISKKSLKTTVNEMLAPSIYTFRKKNIGVKSFLSAINLLNKML